GLAVYGEDDTIPRVTLPMDMKFSCQQANNDDDETFSDLFESIYISPTSDNDDRSTKSQSFTRSYY
ncbi:unnamed protein product, partial [Rotaria magnacalcarata]